MQQKSFLSLGPHGFHRIAYTQWGFPESGRTAICAHGLTRNGRDFDELAQSLTETHQVICPDIAGRGYSDWLLNPADYGFPLYVSDMATLLAKIGDEKVDWIGTSMGGIIGMMLAIQPNSPIQRLIVNDVGPFIPKESLARIGDYLGMDPKFPSLEALEQHIRLIHAPFGELSDEQWKHLAEHSAKKCEDGQYGFHYDPAIGEPFKEAEPVDVDLWPIWEAIQCPVLILRGEDSDLLTAETAQEMLKRGPDAELVEIPKVGHAPTLMDESQIGLVKRWLAG
ncbi:putative carboxylesterase [Candidatus Terasakiella magnetica]|uniref:Putative carboxylesterase n=1 Tax=Candidatus Terasakiella magnetica TaxID=1867952 RepID=A0A1C3RCW3_9PROT|nr:alpha/beta hydrolase [Candidatus Terasakiella magnetica]SCA55110.1 putative carboxylesterase [Candidatus Terasakiella magnetica]